MEIGEKDPILTEAEMSSAIRAITILKQVADELEEATEICSAIQRRYDILRKNIVPGKMESEGISNIFLEGIGRVTVQSKMNASIRKDFKEQAYQWLEDHGHDIITQTVNASTLTALLRRLLEKGEEIPAEMFNMYTYETAVITKK